MKTKKEKGMGKARLTAYCDFQCLHAEFPSRDAVGACRREQAVYCALFGRFNKKNGACIGHSFPGLKREG